MKLDWLDILQIVFMSICIAILLAVLVYSTFIYCKIKKVKRSSPIKYLNFTIVGHICFSAYVTLLAVHVNDESQELRLPLLNYVGQYMIFAFLLEYVNYELKKIGEPIASPLSKHCNPQNTANYFIKFHFLLGSVFFVLMTAESVLEFTDFNDGAKCICIFMNVLVIILNLFLLKAILQLAKLT